MAEHDPQQPDERPGRDGLNEEQKRLRALNPLDLDEDQIREAYEGPLTIRERIDLPERWGEDAAAWIRDVVDDPDWREQDAQLNARIRELTSSILPKFDFSHIIPKVDMGRLLGESFLKPDIGPLLKDSPGFQNLIRLSRPAHDRTADSLIAWDELRERSRESTEAVVVAQDELEKAKATRAPDEATQVLRQLLDHQLREARTTQAYADAQFLEAQRSRIMNRKTLRVTRAATAASVLGGPLAVVLASNTKLGAASQAAVAIVWAVLVISFYWWERADPVLDAVERQQRAAIDAGANTPGLPQPSSVPGDAQHSEGEPHQQ